MSNENVNALLAFLCGAALGCAGALLMAPSSGRKLRKRLRRRGHFAASELRERSGDAVERIGEVISDASENLSTRAKSVVGR